MKTDYRSHIEDTESKSALFNRFQSSVLSPFARILPVLLIFTVLLGFEIFASQVTDRRTRELRSDAIELSLTIEDLVDRVGYTGLIHNFKNCVIRANEPRYCELAQSNAVAALGLVSDIESQLSAQEFHAELTETRTMVEAYQSQIPKVLAGHANGDSVATIDSRVRVDDALAESEIDEVRKTTMESLASKISELQSASRTSTLLGLIFAGVAILVFLIYSYWNERDALMRLSKANKQREQSRARKIVMMNAIHSGILGLKAAGEIILINKAAEEMLGKDLEGRFDQWGDQIRFSDRKSGQRVQGNANPIRRAIAGLTIRDEIYLMAVNDKKEEYVRVSSAIPQDNASGMRSVFVLDIITEQERPGRVPADSPS